MKYSLKTELSEKPACACLILGVFESGELAPSAEKTDRATGGLIKKIIARDDFKANAGDSLLLNGIADTPTDRILLVGLGKKGQISGKAYRKALAAAIKSLKGSHATGAVCTLTEIDVAGADMQWKARQIVEVFEDGVYRFTRLKSKAENGRLPETVEIAIAGESEREAAERGVAIGQAIAEGVHMAKELSNLPGNICTPAYLAEQASGLARNHSPLKVTVLEEADMENLAMNALLSVSRGSQQAAKLIVLEYRGGAENAKPTVLVGKGLTFDAGGISLKPAQAMDEMKYDMCGGASVIGTLATVARLGLPVNVVGIVPASENLPDGAANKPGDVVTSMAGKTIEILNTDAEGRLLLCDALTYAKRFDPATVIDIATLTGACVVALGKHASGLFSNDNTLAEEMIHAGETSCDRVWHLPLWEEYQEQLKSNFADMANVGGRDAGTITAACFLSRFAEKYRWAHLDIAGTAWLSGNTKGATGRPVPLLTQYLLDLS